MYMGKQEFLMLFLQVFSNFEIISKLKLTQKYIYQREMEESSF